MGGVNSTNLSNGNYTGAVVAPINKVYGNTQKDFVQKGLRVVVVGINYSKTSCPLSGCINDAENFIEFIRKRKFGANAELLFLNDGEGSDLIPTKNNILKAIRWLNSTSKASEFNDLDEFPGVAPKGCSLVFYYAGHGSNALDLNGDEADGLDETLCPVTPDGNFDEDIKDDDISEIVSKNSTENNCYIFITDCCHSGTVCDLKYTLSGRSFKRVGNYKETQGVVLHFGACYDYQTAKEGYIREEKESRGFFTHCFIKTLNNARLSVHSFYSRCCNFMVDYVRSSSQFPQVGAGKYITSTHPIPL